MNKLTNLVKDNKKKVAKNLAMIAAAGTITASASGCATAIYGSDHALYLSCNEEDAKITVDGVQVSPGKVYARRGFKNNKIVFSKPGYTTDNHESISYPNPVVLLNGIFGVPGLIIGGIVDFGSNAFWCYSWNDEIKGNIYPLQPTRKEKAKKEDTELMGTLYTGN